MTGEVVINPQRLVLARQIRGIIQKELADMINISAATLSRFENAIDNIAIREDIFDEIYSKLDFQPNFFKKKGSIYYPAMGYFRRNKAVSKRLMDRAVGFMNLFCELIDSNLDLVDIPDLRSISWDIELQGSPEKAAQNLREFWRVPKGRVDKLYEVIENNGIFIIEFDFGSKELDGFSILTQKYGRPVIFVNSTFSEDRKRLTVAHELGHIVMHINDYTISEYRDIEKEAFLFASEFLVPLKELKAQLGKERLTLKKLGFLKQYWRVSMISFIVKVQNNQIVTKNQARYLYQQMAPYRKKEPVDIPRIEKCTLLSEMLNVIETDLEYSNGDLANTQGLTETEFISMRKIFSKREGLRIA